jgi:glyoxylase-like metal-dependent hydrolase (beta-lactamase superfamily II)
MGRLDNRSAQRKQKQAYPPVVVAEEFVDGQVLPVAGGLRVVHTPGHTLGHVALLHEPTGVLVTGDSIWNIRKLRWCIRSFCTDIKMNEQTAAVLGELDYDVAAFTHGAHVSDNARERVRGFLRDAKRFAGGR